MKLSENVLDISHIETWEDIKNTFKGQVEEYPGVNVGPKSGAMGKVWKIKGKDLVLKITTEPAEMKISKKVVGKINEGIVNIYKAVELPSHRYEGRKVPRLMLKIQEFCYPIPELVKRKYSSILSTYMEVVAWNMDYFSKGTFQTFEDFEEFHKGLLEHDDDPVIKTIASSRKIQEEYIPILVKLIDLMKRVEVDLGSGNVEVDLHEGNIMQTKQGVWKLVDF
jgi:hypothetical protein